MRPGAALLAIGLAFGADDPALREALRACRDRIVFETRRDGSWELVAMNADGSNPTPLTRTPEVDELYPRVSPDGTRIAFVADEGPRDARVRNLYVMKSDGTDRRKLADNAREPCWSPDGKRLAYLGGEFERLNFDAWATKGLFVLDLETGERREHPNRNILHLYALNWTPDGRWFIATVHGGMGFRHSIVALEADGEKVYDLRLPGCRPDVSPDGKKIAWGHGDCAIGVADLELSPEPRATHPRNIVESREPLWTYHADWSPDGRFLAFTYGPRPRGRSLRALPQCPGMDAPDWNIGVADASAKNRWVILTSGGSSHKEPDWIPAK
jgi:Tol biopolymer transport system component